MEKYTEDIDICPNCGTYEYLVDLKIKLNETGWVKYMYVCMHCDAYLEYTTLEDLREYRGWCPCGSADVTLIGWVDANESTQDRVTDITSAK
jgi:DNA-directed RNA polymerase subunit RPC12/RpoP